MARKPLQLPGAGTVLLPMVPNFILLPRGGSIALADLSDRQLRAIARAFGQAMLDRAAEQRRRGPYFTTTESKPCRTSPKKR